MSTHRDDTVDPGNLPVIEPPQRGLAEHLEGVAAEEAIRPDVDKAIRQYQRGLLTGAELAEAILLAYPANVAITPEPDIHIDL
jgi:hypothetical protein